MSDCRRTTMTHPRMAEAAAGLAVLLLVALLAVLYTGSSATSYLDRDDGHRRRFTSGLRTTLEPPGEEEPAGAAGPDGEAWAWEPWRNDLLPSEDAGDFQYVSLAKANQNSYEDPLEEYTRGERHDSGHFRHNQNKVWDPHPQYEFAAFGQNFHLNLREDASFAPLSGGVTHVGRDTLKHTYPTHETGCFYSGFLANDSRSLVAVNLCHGMTGHIKTSSGNYAIQPTQNWTNVGLDSDRPLRHKIYRLSRSQRPGRLDVGDNDVVPRSGDWPTSNPRECAVLDEVGGDNEGVVRIDDASESAKIYVGDGEEPADEGGPGGRRRSRRHLSEVAGASNRTTSYDEDDVSSFALEDEHDSNFDYSDYWKKMRARNFPREYFIELMVVADKKMTSYHGKNLVNYVLVLMNTVSRIYKDSSIGNPISIAVIKIKQVDEIFGVRQHGSDGIGAAEMLKKFCQWQKLNNPDEPSSGHHDAALLITRENLCHDPGQKRCDTLGLAELGRMCSTGSSCAVVQDNGLATAFTIAHEIGHVMNMPHDDDPKCARFRDNPRVHNIMSRMLDDNTVPWEWSRCSRHYVTEFLDSGSGDCLLDEPRRADGARSLSYENGRLPGEEYSKNDQCELVYGKGSKICPHMVSDVCKRLWCTVPGWRGEQCHTQHMPWADGTVCDAGGRRWCHRSECVSSRRESLRPVDGQWGAWSPYGNCSRTCGGGIKKKYRECDSPAPENGGNYCVGERIRYKSCATEECAPGGPDFREEQCARFDDDSRGIRNLGVAGTGAVRWHAKYTKLPPEERCKLYCQVAGNQYYMLREKVVDGTACGPDTFHVCVNGRCKPAGCDHALGSRAELDACGVCRGDNSTCRIVSGAYNTSEYGYAEVAEIPAGSSYIDVRQHGWRGSHNDSNYLALRLKEGRRYILNGDFMVMHRKLVVHPGVTIDYSGPEQVVERLNSSRPIRVDLVLEVLSVGSVNPPQITYEYTVPTKLLNKFAWSPKKDWTPCDRMCQGRKYRHVVCLDPESKRVVSENYCPRDEKPPGRSQSCNDHCRLEWREVPNSRSECSSACGWGNSTVKHECVEVPLNGGPRGPPSGSGGRRVRSYACQHLPRPDDRRPCLGPCDRARWRYAEWTACSATCGQHGLQTRSARCVDGDSGDALPEQHCQASPRVVNRPCGRGPCPSWTLGSWSPCSVSCGPGERRRQRYCQVDNHVVPEDQCDQSTAPSSAEDVVQPCDAGPCPTWKTGDWSPCSVTCGDGIRRRAVVCKAYNGTPSDSCDSASKPINLISCALESCRAKIDPAPALINTSNAREKADSSRDNEIDSRHDAEFKPTYTWIIEEFKKCSKPCDGGVAAQVARCVDSGSGGTGPAVSPELCEPSERPKELVTCNEHPCPYWQPSNWTQCDVECGDGYQHRQAACRNWRGEAVSDADCPARSRPRRVRKCQRRPCSSRDASALAAGSGSYEWRAGAWGECSARCGPGSRRREVSCHRVNGLGWPDPSPSERGCAPGDRPAAERPCQTRGCADKYSWTVGPWKHCSQPCGRQGKQARRLFCRDEQRRKVRRLNCPPALRPRRRRRCNQRPCTGPRTCLEARAHLGTDADGEYALFVGGRYVSIYCHGMKGREPPPREYLTLPAGERGNYAEVYDKRLKDASECPDGGRRNDSCDCLDEPVALSGRTAFRKIRVDVRTLRVAADDFEFARTEGLNRIDYGKAGDCYSRGDCPQGGFGIDLTGTQLALSREVQWPVRSNVRSVVNKINDQRVVAKCGGYCGFCRPHSGIKLSVLLP